MITIELVGGPMDGQTLALPMLPNALAFEVPGFAPHELWDGSRDPDEVLPAVYSHAYPIMDGPGVYRINPAGHYLYQWREQG